MTIPPHPTLHGYYETDAERRGAVDELFEAGAPFYQNICRLMSMGTGEGYRRRALQSAGLVEGMRILDVGTGTGMMLRPAVALSGAQGFAVGLDSCLAMLRECGLHTKAPLLRALGEHLPFANGSFDMVSMGYALRHVDDLRGLFDEYKRVMRAGGRVLILELTPPQSYVGRLLIQLYLRNVVPGVARIASGTPAARKMMRYFWDTIEACVSPEVILSTLRVAGFHDVTRRLHGGILSEYTATKR